MLDQIYQMIFLYIKTVKDQNSFFKSWPGWTLAEHEQLLRNKTRAMRTRPTNTSNAMIWPRYCVVDVEIVYHSGQANWNTSNRVHRATCLCAQRRQRSCVCSAMMNVHWVKITWQVNQWYAANDLFTSMFRTRSWFHNMLLIRMQAYNECVMCCLRVL